jgi:ferredoxin-NADP reductase/ferredoxin
MKNYNWKTYKVVQETEDAVTLFFDTGQAVFSYQPGQYLNITCNIDGEKVSRSYSFSSAVTDKFPSITVKRIADGKMSNYIVNNARHISEWNVEAPFGNFVQNKQLAKESEIVFLGGGSGISPLFSMLKSLEGSVHKPLLLYANSTPENTIFIRDLEGMQVDNQLQIFYSFSAGAKNIDEWNAISGRFSQPVIQSIIRQQVQAMNTAHYFVCGPIALMQLYKDSLSAMHIPESQIHTEYFNPILVNNISPGIDVESKDVLVNYFESHFVNDEFQTYGCTCLIEVQGGQSLLDAMIANNISVPNSCKKGTCGSCWATKENGNVNMIINYALTDEEVAEGKILLCQSFPLDQAVSIVIG